MIRIQSLMLAAVLAVVVVFRASAADVSIHTEDGVTLSAVWTPAGQPAPAVLLLHSYLRSHADWDAVAGRLHEAGVGVLELDLRGHGRSGGNGTDQFTMFPQDVKAAL